MAYIPCHKRNPLKDADQSTLTSHFKETLNLNPSSRRGRGRKDRHGAGKIIYSLDSIFRWWPIGAPAEDDPIPSSFHLEPFDCEIVERREGEKPLVLVGGGHLEDGASEERDKEPWVSIAERVVPDLIAAAAGARNELKRDGNEGVKLNFIARLGKNIFHGKVKYNILQYTYE